MKQGGQAGVPGFLQQQHQQEQGRDPEGGGCQWDCLESHECMLFYKYTNQIDSM